MPRGAGGRSPFVSMYKLIFLKMKKITVIFDLSLFKIKFQQIANKIHIE